MDAQKKSESDTARRTLRINKGTGKMIKRVWRWLKSLFRRRAIPPTPHAPGHLDEELAKKIAKRKERYGRFVLRRAFGPRMPKYQPCPLCRGSAKRKAKSIGGASYYCRKCKHGFFIGAQEGGAMAKQCKYSDILVSPQELKFEMLEGSDFIPPYQIVRLTKASSDLTPRWLAVANANWVYYRPQSGKAPKQVQVSTSHLLAPAIYKARLLLSSPEYVAILPLPYIDITLEVRPINPPPSEPPEVPPPEPPDEAPTEPPTEPPVEPPTEPPVEPPVEPPAEESWWVRFWKWLLGLFGGA